MVAYEFYLVNAKEEFHLFGILPERKKDSSRVTQESIMKWGKLIGGDCVDVKRTYFIQAEVSLKFLSNLLINPSRAASGGQWICGGIENDSGLLLRGLRGYLWRKKAPVR
jgi:hypothetical protein